MYIMGVAFTQGNLKMYLEKNGKLFKTIIVYSKTRKRKTIKMVEVTKEDLEKKTINRMPPKKKKKNNKNFISLF